MPPYNLQIPATVVGTSAALRQWYVDANGVVQRQNDFKAYRGVQHNDALSMNVWAANTCGNLWDLLPVGDTDSFHPSIPRSDYVNRPRIGNPAIKMTAFSF